MSLTFAFDGTESTLSASYFPPIELEENSDYQVGLLSFETYNSIPNVDETNNKFHYGGNKVIEIPTGESHYDGGKVIEIPTGAYEVKDIAEYLRSQVKRQAAGAAKQDHLEITVNNNTMQTSIKATFPIDFTKPDSIGKLLGFKENEVIPAGKRATTTGVVDVFNINAIRIECSIATGSYVNSESAHTIYQFYPSTPAGYILLEIPSPVIYLPVTTRTIDSITLRIVDQTGRLVNFRGERISVRIHVKKVM